MTKLNPQDLNIDDVIIVKDFNGNDTETKERLINKKHKVVEVSHTGLNTRIMEGYYKGSSIFYSINNELIIEYPDKNIKIHSYKC